MIEERYRKCGPNLGVTLVETLIVIGILVVAAALLLPGISTAIEARNRASCANHMRQVILAMQMFANDETGRRFPPMKKQGSSGSYPNVCDTGIVLADIFFDGPTLFPSYVKEPDILVCPSDPDGDTYKDLWFRGKDGGLDPCSLSSLSYGYVGWAVTDDILVEGDSDPNGVPPILDGDALEALGEAFADTDFVEDNLTFTSDADGQITLYRLRTGVERFLITDVNSEHARATAASQIAVFFDHAETPLSGLGPPAFNHLPGGGNAAYLDGHVEYMHYGSRYPFSVAWTATFGIFRDFSEL